MSLSSITSQPPSTTSATPTKSSTSSASPLISRLEKPQPEQTALSKNQLRRERKRKYREEKKIKRKQLKKQRKIENRNDENGRTTQRDENELDKDCHSQQPLASNGGENELSEEQNGKCKSYVKKHRSVARREQFNDVVERLNSPFLVIDCSYTNLQTEKEAQSLVQQLMLSYAANRASASPFRLALTSINEKTKSYLNKITGWDNWNCLKDERHFTDLFDKNNIIYLSADSKFVIDSVGATESRIYNSSIRDTNNGITSNYTTYHRERNPLIADAVSLTILSPSDTLVSQYGIIRAVRNLSAEGEDKDQRALMAYVIGGIVDRNRLKGICYKDSVDRNIHTARLPIQEHLSKPTKSAGGETSSNSSLPNKPSASSDVDNDTLVTGNKVLTIDQVVAMLLKYRETGDWHTAIHQAVPKRKMIRKQKPRPDSNDSFITDAVKAD